MQVEMNYGKDGLIIELPDDLQVDIVRKSNMPAAPDPRAAVRDALMNPIGAKLISEEARGCKSACIAICDITRPVPNSLLLPLLVRQLIDAGIPASRITVIVATGMHRPNEGEELRELVGDEWVLNTVEIVNHCARNDEDHVFLGATRKGTPVGIDRRFVEADLRLVVGLVEPHFMAGYSGGRKLITPGLAHVQTISRVHSGAFLESSRTANCVLHGNPFNEELVEIAAMLGEVRALNVVIDERRRLSYVNYGDIEKSHSAAVDYLQDYSLAYMPQHYKTVITSAAGYPLDKTFYQTVKGIVGAAALVEPGGNLIVVSECSEGLGSPDYAAAQSRMVALGPKAYVESMQKKRHADVDEWQTYMQLRATKHSLVYLYSTGLSITDFALTGVNRVVSLNQTITRLTYASGNARVAVIPEGPYVIPVAL